jgi:hypothetical protein
MGRAKRCILLGLRAPLLASSREARAQYATIYPANAGTPWPAVAGVAPDTCGLL